MLIRLIGVAIVVLGLILKFDTIATVVLAGIVTGLVGGMGIMDILKAAQQYADERICNDCGSNLDAIAEDGDFWDADALFQIAMYGEVIYG